MSVNPNREIREVEDDEIVINFASIFKALKKNLVFILLATIICGVVAYGATKIFITPMYRASFSIYVNNNASGQKDSLTSSDISAAKSLANTYSEIIVSRTVLNKAAEKVGLNVSYERLASLVSAKVSSTTELITVYVQGISPTNAFYLAESIEEVASEQISTIIEGSSMRVVDEPVVPENIYSPNYMKNLALGLIIGLLISVAVVVIMDIMDDKIKDEKTLEERFGYVVIGTIPNAQAAEKTSGTYGYGYGQKPTAKPQRGGRGQ